MYIYIYTYTIYIYIYIYIYIHTYIYIYITKLQDSRKVCGRNSTGYAGLVARLTAWLPKHGPAAESQMRANLSLLLL